MPNYEHFLKVGFVVILGQNVRLDELEKIIQSGPEQLEKVRQGVRARLTGEFNRYLDNNRAEMIIQFEEDFDKNWDEMLAQHNKRMGRKDDTKGQTTTGQPTRDDILGKSLHGTERLGDVS